MKIQIPLDVPQAKRDTYSAHYELVTRGSGRLFLFAGDQKMEHLNDDFHGEGIAPDDASPEHLFRIAGKGRIGAFASQLGLIARYGGDYTHVPYIVKLNSKTHLIKSAQRDPYSAKLISVDAVMRFRESSGLQIAGVGYTIYPGSEYEGEMISEAAKITFEAHQQGLISVIWSYPRGKSIVNEKDSHLTAGVAGVAACLGADFVKVNAPKSESGSSAELLKEAVLAAGRTKVICAGGSSTSVKAFLQSLHDQIHVGGCAGNATGRNIHQKPLDEAVRFCDAIYAITVEDKSVDEAMALYVGT